MTNTNCLENIRCPKCGQNERFQIVAEVVMDVTDNGSEDKGSGHTWDENSACFCPECEFNEILSFFTGGAQDYETIKAEAAV